MNLDVDDWEASSLHEMIEVARHRVVEAARWAKPRKRDPRSDRATLGGMLSAAVRSPSSTTSMPPGFQDVAHLTEARRRIREMQEQEPTVDEIETRASEAGRGRTGFDKAHVAESRVVTALPGLLQLIAAHVDAGHMAGGPDDFGEHLRHRADAAPEVGDPHARGEPSLEQHAFAAPVRRSGGARSADEPRLRRWREHTCRSGESTCAASIRWCLISVYACRHGYRRRAVRPDSAGVQ